MASGENTGAEKRKFGKINVEDPSHFQEIGTNMLGFAKLEDGSKRVKPKFHGTRAHANPLADMLVTYPTSPADFDITRLFTRDAIERCGHISVADVGCGYGGMTMRLAELFPNKLIIGLEIREAVVEYAQEQILKQRAEDRGGDNAAVIRSNAMKHFPCYFRKGQLDTMLFLFPDPHFKKSNHRRRIISVNLLAEYAYALKKGAIVYTATDVFELRQWMDSQFTLSPMFQEIPDSELKGDPVVAAIGTATADAERALRKDGTHYIKVYRRV
ncbi:tRNA (guanine-N-7) methyltransferase [Carpediemonas membranifera]|uniref:tRNA (guanine-N(7)-)-methyltransferase n=1 Tax=Carpediemonas membranifera TaxID=201153 RepID=A0A8J6B0N5_9EUKA|nr:tRNA (guanine-N-7) methyltransferase [Carpediemonas membranifera]|eukprot:KAG9396785.1 tRNA (guanine-N-7) methyltransferase [Carpediemonas membranifera]